MMALIKFISTCFASRPLIDTTEQAGLELWEKSRLDNNDVAKSGQAQLVNIFLSLALDMMPVRVHENGRVARRRDRKC